MKKIIFLLLALGIGIYFFFFRGEKEPEIMVEEEIIPQKKKIEPPPPNFLKEEEKPLQRPYLGPDYKPIDPPSGKMDMGNSINPNLEEAIRGKLLNPDVPGMSINIKMQGTFILVKSGLGVFVEQILVTITNPGEDTRTFNAYADSETGEIIHTVEPYQATYSAEDIQPTEVEIPEEDRGGDNFFEEPPPDSDMSFPVDE
jgi:hypothetical protein